MTKKKKRKKKKKNHVQHSTVVEKQDKNHRSFLMARLQNRKKKQRKFDKVLVFLRTLTAMPIISRLVFFYSVSIFNRKTTHVRKHF